MTVSLTNVQLGLLLAFLVVAAVVDYRKHRIPNDLIVVMGVTGLLLLLVTVQSNWTLDLLTNGLLGALVGFTLFLPFYALRGMGAGDVKLMAAAGLFLGPLTTAYAVGASLCIGAAGGIVYIAILHLRRSTQMQPNSTTNTQAASLQHTKIPFAIAILSGTVTALLFT